MSGLSSFRIGVTRGTGDTVLDASEGCSAPLPLSLAMDAGLSQGDRGCKRGHPSSYRCGFLFLCVFGLFLISIRPSSSLCFSLKLVSPHCAG